MTRCHDRYRSRVVAVLRAAVAGIALAIPLAAEAATPRDTTIPVGDLVFDAAVSGPENGELVLLLHGFPQAGIAFRAQLQALGDAGYRAVAPDQRGYSPGARPEGVDAYSMNYLVGDVLGIADALGGGRFHLVGHDWGGAVAWVTATRHPDRLRTLTVLSTPHFAAFRSELSNPESEQSRRSSYFKEFAAPDAPERFLANDRALLREVLSEVPASFRESYVRRLGTREAMRAALSWYRAAAPRPARGDGEDRRAAVPNSSPVRAPTLYVWGTQDGAFGRTAAERTADFVAGPYEFRPLEGAGHWLPELVPDTVTRLLLDHLRREGMQE